MVIGGYSNWDLVLDIKDQNAKAQPSTFKIVSLRGFWKVDIFDENKKRLKIRYLEIRIFIKKSSAKIQPRHLGCTLGFSKRTRPAKSCRKSRYFEDFLSQISRSFDCGCRKKSWRWRNEVGSRGFEVGGWRKKYLELKIEDGGHQDLRISSRQTNI